MRWLWVLLLLAPAANACTVEVADAVGDQEVPWPPEQYDLLALNITSGDDHLTLNLHVDGLRADASTAQYLFHFGHRSWVYMASCRAYTVDAGAGDPGCSMSRSPARGEAAAGTYRPVADLPVLMVDGWLSLPIPYALLDAHAGDVVDVYYGASQVAASGRTPEQHPSNSTASPHVLDQVFEEALQVALCGDGGASAVAPASDTGRQDKDVPALPILAWLAGLLVLARRSSK